MARVIRVYDGDTCTVLYFVNETPTKMNIRIEGIDTPEIRSNSELEKQAGKLIRDILQYFLLEKIVLLKIYDWDKYGGRILGMIYYTFKGYEPYGQLSVKNFLLEKNYAKPYDGTTKKKGFDENELKDIIHKATLELQSFE
jgi:endonuclease YncB( thermonuclease family)